ncbi:hypothetical protein [Prescottella equi]
MSTDNREQQLFPDVIEHYGTEPTPADDAPVSGGLDFPIPAETFAEADAAVFEHDLEPLDVEQDSVVQTDLEPIDTESIIQTDLEPIDAPAAAADAEAEQFAAVAPQAYSEWAPESASPQAYSDGAFVDEHELLPLDPYADAPDWVRAHIPREPLVAIERTRGGFKSVVGRLRVQRPAAAATALPAADVPPSDPTEPVAVAGDGDGGGGRSGGKTFMLVGAGVAALSVVTAGAVLAFTGDSGETPVPPLPESTSSAEASAETTAAAPAWCETVNEPDRIVGNGAGGRDSGPAVIQAFEHAYYVKRSGDAVASLMVMPSPVAEIQSFIDAVPVGTDHCVTVLPTPDPNRWSVDVLLRIPPVGSEGIHRQWITTAPGDGGMKIATVEDRK